jgi:carboxyl-terminal processing protease
MKHFTLPVILLLTGALGFAGQTARTPDLNRKTFEKIWSTVNDRFYDPGFLGVDWKRAHDRYVTQAGAATTDENFYRIVNEMLGLIHVSHLQALSPAVSQNKPAQTPGITGLRLRSADAQVVVFQSLPGLPAASAGIRAGFAITAIDGVPPADPDAASKALAGPAGSSVRIRVLDEHDAEREIVLTRKPSSAASGVKELESYTLFNSKRLDGGVGYLWFSGFAESLSGRLAAAIDAMHDARALIIDLRGNGGGDDAVGIRLADTLLESATQLMLVRTRTGINRDLRTRGNAQAYRGRVAIIVDGTTASAAEDFAAALQEAGRASIVGTRSAGADLDADTVELPDRGMLIYPFGLTTTPKGVIIEGRGVTPDLVAPLKRSDLLAGRDTQIAAALDYLKTSTR